MWTLSVHASSCVGTLEHDGAVAEERVRRSGIAVGTVLHVASALGDQAHRGQILATQRAIAAVGDEFEVTGIGELALPGFPRPVAAFDIQRAHADAQSPPLSPLQQSTPTLHGGAVDSGPLSEREREVVTLIAQGCSNRQIAQQLVIAEGTAVRHVANVLNKLGFHSRAQIAVWAVQRDIAR